MPIHLAAFVTTIALLAVLPGANNAAITRQVLSHGRRAGLLTVAGTSTGILIWAAAAALGLSAVLLASPRAYLLIRLAGAALLVLLGCLSLWSLRRPPAPAPERRPARDVAHPAPADDAAQPAPADDAAQPAQADDAAKPAPGGDVARPPLGRLPRTPLPGVRSFVIGVAASLGNPKAGVFAISFLPQFVTLQGPVLASSILLGALWSAISGTWFCLYVWAVDRGRARVTRPAVQRLLQAATGVTMLGLGVAVAAGV